jgi:DinB family protein
VSIPADTKDWTWVLGARCPECGLDTREIALADVPVAVRDVSSAFGHVLAAGEATRRRPDPSVWSPLEYACHVRDVCRLFGTRLHLMLMTDDPQFENWDQDATALENAYGEQDPARVASELTEAADRLAGAFERVPEGAQGRQGRRSDGAVFTVTTLGRYLVHDLVHHVYDVTRGRAAPATE